MKTYPITHYEKMMVMETMGMSYIIQAVEEIVKNNDAEFLEFTDKMVSNIQMNNLLKAHGMESGNMTIRMAFHIWKMKNNGEKIYYMDSHICDLLRNTKLTIDAEFIESPFKEIYLYTDQTEITMTDETGTRPMKGVYVHLCVEEDGIKKIRFLATSGAIGIEDGTDINHFACFHIPEHGTLEDICEQQLKMYRELHGDSWEAGVSESDVRNIFKFVVNSLIYIGCRNADLCPIKPLTLEEATVDKKSNKKIKKLARKFEKSAQKPFIYITHKTLQTSNGTGTGKKLGHEVLVGGYWRGQWYGPRDGTREKRVIRIDSYTKGAGLEQKKSSKYIVK